MKVIKINDPKLYCEDDNGNFDSILSEGDCVMLQTIDEYAFEGSIEIIHDDSIEIDDCDNGNMEIMFSNIAYIKLT